MFIDLSGRSIDDGAILLGNSGQGDVGRELERIRFEPGLRRPYLYNGRPHVTINSGKVLYNNQTGTYHPERINISLDELATRYGLYSPVANATLLTKDAWIELD